METLSNWTVEDFLTYLFIFGATADLDIGDDERERIIQRMGEKEFEKAKRIFDRHNDVQHIETITFLYNKFKSQIGDKDKLVEALKEVIVSSSKEGELMDHLILRMLNRIL